MQILKARSAFTLIEILIVVAIIGILASVVLVGLGPVQRQGRDARRISDLRQVQTGLELYYGKNGNYPLTMEWGTLQSTLKSANIGVTNVADDPNATQHYLYGSDGIGYIIGAKLDDHNNPSLKDDVDGNDASTYSINCTGTPVSPATDAVYCVRL
jgi:prepilin-type N-terminal cleavage/methylation domain-containing protein